MTATIMKKQWRIQLKAADLPKSGLDYSLDGVMNFPGCLNAEEIVVSTGKPLTDGKTHKRGSGVKIGRPVTTSARSETDANTVSGIVQE